MTKLSVNINKLATLRNSRGKNNPDLLHWAKEILRLGAYGITVHPRPDERHVRRQDVYDLKKLLGTQTELNVEGYPSEDFLKMVVEVQPAQCTLVPDPPEALTSNAGWRVLENEKVLAAVAKRLRAANVRISVFVDPETTTLADLECLKRIGVHRIELYTEKYAENYGHTPESSVIASYRQTAEMARAQGLGINAGHDLNTQNLAKFVREIPGVDEVSIGHALICDALELGMAETLRRYLACLKA